MKTIKGTVVRASVYARDNGIENVVAELNTGNVAHLPWANFQNAGVMLPAQLIGTDIEVSYLEKGEKTLNGSVCDKDDTLVASFVSDAMIDAAEAFGQKIQDSLASEKAKAVLSKLDEQAKIRANARKERLAKLRNASPTPANTPAPKKAPSLDGKGD